MARVPGIEMTRFATGEWLPMPLGKEPQVAIAGGKIYVGAADSGVIDVFEKTGKAAGSVRFKTEAQAPSSENVAAALDIMAGPTVGAGREQILARLRTLEVPKALPAHTALMGDELGVLWVVQSSPGDRRTRIIALNRSGRQVAALSLQGERRLLDVGSDYLLTSGSEADGSPMLLAHRLYRTAP